MFKHFFLILFYLLSLITSLSAQNIEYELRGRILSESGDPIPDVKIVNIVENIYTLTDEKGFFSLKSKTSDIYYLAILHISYETKKIKVKGRDNNIVIRLSLKYSDIPEITIDGKTFNTVREKLDILDLKYTSNPSLNNNIESLLVTMGGVSNNNELSNQYNVRGGNFDENVIYINGIEMIKPFLIRKAQQEGLSFINPLMINKIDFSRGGFTAEYGDKMSSVLDVGYKRSENKFEGAMNSSFLGGGLYLGSSSKLFSQVTSLRYRTTSNILNTSDIKGEYKPKFSNIQTFMVFNIMKNMELSLLANYDNSIFKMTPQSRETKFGTIFDAKNFYVNYSGNEDDGFMTYQSSIALKYKPMDNLELNFSGTTFGSKEHERYDILAKYKLSDFSESEDSTIGMGVFHEYARNRLRSNINTLAHSGKMEVSNHEIRWGINYQHKNISDQIQQWQLVDSASYSSSVSNDLNLINSIYSKNKIRTNRISGYLQDTYRLESKEGLWIFNLGFRASYGQFNKEHIFSPRGVIAFIPEKNDNLTFRVSGGIYYQAPVYKELQQLVVNNDIYNYQLNNKVKSQKSIHLVLGNDFNFLSGDNRLKLTTELYYKKLSKINPYTVDNVKIEYLGQNIGKGYIAGMDIRLFGEFIKDVDSWISLSLMKTNQKFDGLNIPLSSDQRYNVSFFLQDYMPGYNRLTASIRGVFADGLPFFRNPLSFSENYFRYPAYKRLDVGFAWQLLGENFAIRKRNSFIGSMKDIWLGLDFFNILDIKNTNTYYWVTDTSGVQYAVPNYLTGRMINLKLSITF